MGTFKRFHINGLLRISLLVLCAGALITLAVMFVWATLRFGADTILGVVTQVANSTTHLGPFLLESVLIGIATMALIQSVRAIYPIRGLFHRQYIDRWLRSTVSKQSPKLLSELMSLAVATDSRALFDLPAEHLIAQLGAAADIIVASPADHVELLLALAGEAGRNDTDHYIRMFGGRRDQANPDPVYVDVRNRVAQLIQRRMDGLHISMGRQWRLILRLTAIGVATLFAFVASLPNASVSRETNVNRLTSESGILSSHEVGDKNLKQSPQIQTAPRSPEEREKYANPTGLQRGLFVAIIGLVSGFMASLSRDAVAIVEKLRR
jgi:hypothetical protein